jgi:hypothetical protein
MNNGEELPMDRLHEPDADFARYLEWQTRTELRRAARFEPAQVRRAPFAPLLRSAALVLFSLFAGGGLVFAVEELQQSREAELLLERNALRVQLAERRVQVAGEALEREDQLYREGFNSIGSVQAARQRVAELERERDQLRLDRSELESSGRPANRDLWAPLVGSRDFVTESLHIDRRLAEARVAHARANLERLTQLVDVGVVSQAELFDKRAMVERRAAELQGLDERLELRTRFLTGSLERRDLERLVRLEAAREQREALTADLEAAVAHLERTLVLEREGRLASGSAELQLKVDSLRVELQLIDLELELIGGLVAPQSGGVESDAGDADSVDQR